MIISHKHKYIFFAVPKTATHAIREALREHKGPDDWEQQMLFGRNAFPVPALAAIQHGHLSVQQLRPHISPEMFSDYFKFAFVRNPYDRYISTFFFLTRNQQLPPGDKKVHLKQAIRSPQFTGRILVQPQYKMLVDETNTLALDYLGRYEDIQASYDHICERIGIPSKSLIEKNASDHQSSESYYDDELRQLVTDFYRGDFELLGYDKMSGGAAAPTSN